MEQEILINQSNNQEILINSNDPQLISINNVNIQDLEINQNENQDISINQADNQVILIDSGGAVIGITDVLVNGVSVVSGNIAYVLVPTKTSELTNDSGFLTSETDPTVPSYVKAISLADINNWNNKQNALVSGSTIKTINNTSLLGSGNIEIDGTVYTAGTGININNNIISNTITNYNDLTDLPTIPTKTSELINDNDYVSEDDLAEVSFTGSYNSLSDTPIIPDSTSDLTNDSGFITNSVNNLTNYMLTTDINTALGNKQDTLISGTNIKTINNTSLLGSGDISVGGGTATDVQINGSSIVNNNVANIITESAYNSSTNKIATKNDIPTSTSQLSNDSGFITNSVNNLTNYMLTTDINTALSSKQDTLVSGTNIKTINNISLLGNGNLNTNKLIECKLNADTTITNSYTDINILEQVNNIGNAFTVSNGKIKIGSNINKIKITINYGTYCSTATTLYSYITKNGSTVGNWLLKEINKYDSACRVCIIDVTENDLISFNVYTSNSTTLYNYTNIIVESI